MTGARLGRIAQGGIIAAGEGSRLRAGGWPMSKPMVPVAGRPLIDHALDRFRAAGIGHLAMHHRRVERRLPALARRP